jgi:hypothetical protein
VKFKSPHMEDQYKKLPAKLKEIAELFDSLSSEMGIDAVVTRVADPVKGESGVHIDYRAIDFRNEVFDGRKRKWTYSIESVDEILAVINNLYRRDDRKLTAIHHSFNGGPAHFHCQIQAKDVTDDDRRLRNGLDACA